MNDLRIDNRVQLHERGLLVRLGLDVEADTLAEPLRRLQAAGATIAGVRHGDGVVPFDRTASTTQNARRVRDAQVATPFDVLLSNAPGLGDVEPAAAAHDMTPQEAAASVRCSAELVEKLAGRGLKARVERQPDGPWSFTARSRALGGRPKCLRKHLDHPKHAREFLENDAIQTWGFELAFSTWRRGTPAYDNVWRHPSGVSVHVACRPTEEHTMKAHKRVYSLATYGLWAGEGPPPLVSAQPGSSELRDAVLDGIAAWVCFGPIR